MTATGHAIIGTLIAAKISNPTLAIPLALASHIFADLYPHWDSGTHGKEKTSKQLFIESSIDVLLGFLIGYILIITLFKQTSLAYAFVIIIAAQFFDWASAPYFIFHIESEPFNFIHKIQSLCNTRLDKPWGIVSQAALLIPLIAIAKVF